MRRAYLWISFLVLAVYDKLQSNAYTLNGVLAASFLSGMLTLLYNVLSLCILVGKTFSRGNGAGFSYGFLCSSCIHLSFTLLLAGLVLNSFKDTVRHFESGEVAGWSKGDTVAFHATYSFAYVCFALLFLYFFLLIIFRSALRPALEGAQSDPSFYSSKSDDGKGTNTGSPRM